MELVEDDPVLRRILRDRVPERLPYVHGGQFDAGALLLAQRLEKQVDVSLFATLTTDPDGPLPVQVTDDNPVVMSLVDGDLVNADGPGLWQLRQVNLFMHVELVEIFHRAVVQALYLGDGLVRHIPAQLVYMHGKALGIARILCQPVKMLYMHAATHGPGRLDLVYRGGGLDVPADGGNTAGRATGSRRFAHRTLYPGSLGIVQNPLPLSRDGLPHHRQARG